MSTRRKNRRPSLKGSLNPSKRHRDRVNVELDNLAKLLPFPPEVIAKLDKLSVLRLSASYLRTKNFFKGLNFPVEKNTKSSPDFVLDEIEKNGKLSDLLLEALDGFLMVLTQQGELFYASETISDYLGVSQASVIHQDFLRFVHVDDQKLLENNLKLVPSPPEQKICEISDDEQPEENGKQSDDGTKERSFICRFKCILNTNAGFFKPFKCHGRLREVDVPDADIPNLALFLICSPLEITTSILEVRMKSMLFCTKNKLDLTFVDIDQKGKQIVGYTKKDLAAQSSYCMMHYDDIPVLKRMHQDLLLTGKCEGSFRWLNKHMKWQWLTGSAQVIFKNSQPDFVITTNKPLSDEEGEEEVRRREREYGIAPTSPATMLSHLQLAEYGPPSSVASCESPGADTTQRRFTHSAGPSVSSITSPEPSLTSCASLPDCFSPEDLPWDQETNALFEASGASWDTQDSLTDLDNIGKGDLVGDMLNLGFNDLTFDAALEEAGLSENTGSQALHFVQDHSSSSTQPESLLVTSQAPAWPPSERKPSPENLANQHQFATPLYPVSPNQHGPVNNAVNTNMSNQGAASSGYGSQYPSMGANYGAASVSPSGRPPSAVNYGATDVSRASRSPSAANYGPSNVSPSGRNPTANYGASASPTGKSPSSGNFGAPNVSSIVRPPSTANYGVSSVSPSVRPLSAANYGVSSVSLSGRPPSTANYGAPKVSPSGRPTGNYGATNLSAAGEPATTGIYGVPRVSSGPALNVEQNGGPLLGSGYSYANQPGLRKYPNGTTNPTMVGGQSGLLQVQTEQSLNRPYIKTEPRRASPPGYFCNTTVDQQGVSGMPGVMANGVPLPGHSTQSNTSRYQNRLINQGGFASWGSAPPSPYSSGSSSSSSYADALQVQFSPTEVLTSPFASPRDDSDCNLGNVPASGPMPAQFYAPNGNYRVAQHPRNMRGGPAHSYVNIPEISPVGMVEELVTSVHHTTPISAQNPGVANW